MIVGGERWKDGVKENRMKASERIICKEVATFGQLTIGDWQ